MRTIILTGLLFACVPWLLPSASLACTCIPIPFSQEVEESDAIFSGRVIDKKPSGDPVLPVEVTVLLHLCWKGTLSDTVRVLTHDNPVLCGFYFNLEREYLIFAYGTAQLRTGLCTSTHETYPGDPYLDLLGPPKGVGTEAVSWGRAKAAYR